jgi:hypothetical protein
MTPEPPSSGTFCLPLAAAEDRDETHRSNARHPQAFLDLVRVFFTSRNHRKHRRHPHLRRDLIAGDGTLASL